MVTGWIIHRLFVVIGIPMHKTAKSPKMCMLGQMTILSEVNLCLAVINKMYAVINLKHMLWNKNVWCEIKCRTCCEEKMYALINKMYAVINLKHKLWRKNVCCDK